jgi:hypothetical protein
VTVAIVRTGYTLPVVEWVPDVEWLAALALQPLGVVATVETFVQPVGSGTVRVTVALAFDAAVCSHIAKVAFAHVGLHARSSHTSLNNKGLPD